MEILELTELESKILQEALIKNCLSNMEEVVVGMVERWEEENNEIYSLGLRQFPLGLFRAALDYMEKEIKTTCDCGELGSDNE